VETRKLTLETAVEFRERLDREIHENYQTIVSSNSSDKKKQRKDLRELLRLTEVMEDQVIGLKEIIQKTNLKRHSFERKSNSYYIFRLSQLKTRKLYLMKTSTRVGNVGKITYVTEFKITEIDRMLHQINDEINKISDKLSKFNTMKKNELKIKVENDLLHMLN